MAEKSSRMLSLLSLLQTQRDWPGPVLAERLKVTPRTVRRDVERLRELGYSIAAIKGPDGGYRLAAGSELPPLLFDDEQAVAIAVALQSVRSSGVDIDEAAARALSTVRQVMPSRLRHRIDGIRFTDSAATARVDPAVLEAVSGAVRDQRTLRFDYRGAVDDDGAALADLPPRRVEPHAVVARREHWYLVAWDLERDDWRTFRLDRMTPRMPGGAPFARRPLPTGDVATLLAARSKGSETEDRWPCRGEFRIALPARQIVPYLDDGELEELPDGTCRVVAGSWSWTGLVAWVLRFDAHFEIVGPASIEEAAATLSSRLLRARTPDAAQL
ncbi:helix-turn-helix transcriptional regulator [Marisediminicola sp. LYQ85]|uniref:helix-turn-helix transcriptional regulator n=1 Tax=Marisediminicola sp. LYQ85 TaxID=3391062 RepID=UPI003983764C